MKHLRSLQKRFQRLVSREFWDGLTAQKLNVINGTIERSRPKDLDVSRFAPAQRNKFHNKSSLVPQDELRVHLSVRFVSDLRCQSHLGPSRLLHELPIRITNWVTIVITSVGWACPGA